jgi:hypothetical protein
MKYLIIVFLLIITVITLTFFNNRTEQIDDSADTIVEVKTEGNITSYDEETIANVMAETIVIYFFHEPSDEQARELNDDLVINRDAISETVSVLRVDLSDNRELANQYGVTEPGVLVVVDSSGNETQKFTDVRSVAELNRLLRS